MEGARASATRSTGRALAAKRPQSWQEEDEEEEGFLLGREAAGSAEDMARGLGKSEGWGKAFLSMAK